MEGIHNGAFIDDERRPPDGYRMGLSDRNRRNHQSVCISFLTVCCAVAISVFATVVGIRLVAVLTSGEKIVDDVAFHFNEQPEYRMTLHDTTRRNDRTRVENNEFMEYVEKKRQEVIAKLKSSNIAFEGVTVIGLNDNENGTDIDVVIKLKRNFMENIVTVVAESAHKDHNIDVTDKYTTVASLTPKHNDTTASEGVSWQETRRTKRQIAHALYAHAFGQHHYKDDMDFANRPCPPGFTGELCENVLCLPGTAPAPECGPQQPGNVMVALEMYPLSCVGATVFPVDSHSHTATMVFNSNATAPGDAYVQLTVTNATNDVVPFTVIKNSSDGSLVVRFNAPPGFYMANHDGVAPCSVGVSLVSDVDIKVGYTTGPKAVFDDEPATNMTVNAPSYLVTDVGALPCPGGVTHLWWYRNGALLIQLRAKTRWNCQWEHYFGIINCFADGLYHYKIAGIDEKGFAFQRIGLTNCLAPMGCLNGGTLLPDGTCSCPPFFDGDHCETIICTNGGTFDPATGQCLCPPGFSGVHCEYRYCEPPSTIPYVVGRRITYVFVNRPSMAEDKRQMISGTQAMINYFQQNDQNYIQEWQLITLCGGAIQSQTTADSAQFMTYLNGIVVSPACGGCKDDILGALNKTMLVTKTLYKSSPTFVFTDTANQADQLMLTKVLQKNAFLLERLYFITTAVGGCPLFPDAMPLLSQESQGHFVRLSKPDVSKLLPAMAPMIRRTEMLYSIDFVNCSAISQQFHTFYLSSVGDAFFISIVGGPSTVELTHPNGVSSVLMPVSVGDLSLYSVDANSEGGPVAKGRYQLRLNGPQTLNAPCALRVAARSNVALFVAYSDGGLADFTSLMPVYDKALNPVAGFYNVSAPNTNAMTLQQPNIMIPPAHNSSDGIIASGIPRQNCAYNIWFVQGFSCRGLYGVYYVTVTATDGTGLFIQRQVTVFCSDITPTPEPPAGCLNGGILINGTCICPPGWTGLRCEMISCLNGGKPLIGGMVCSCPPGFTGKFCEIGACIDKNPTASFGPNGRTLAFAIEESLSMTQVVHDIQEQIQFIINVVTDQHPAWFNRYVLVGFNDTDIHSMETGDPLLFIQAIGRIQNYPTPSCPQVVLSALEEILRRQSGLYGLTYVFADSSIKLNETQFNAVTAGVVAKRMQVNYILFDPLPCPNDPGQGDVGVPAMLAAESNGQLIVTRTPHVLEVLSTLATEYQAGTVLWNGATDCVSENVIFYFPIDSHTTAFTVSLLGFEPNMTLFEPDGSPYQPIMIVNDLDYFLMGRAEKTTLPQTFAGNWKVVASTSNSPDGKTSCDIRVRAQSDIQAHHGYVMNIHNDYPKMTGLLGSNMTHLVTHITGMTGQAVLESVKIWQSTFPQPMPLGQFRRFVIRDNCFFEWITGEIFCNGSYWMSMSGIDEHGYHFERGAVLTCKQLECQNGGTLLNPPTTCACLPLWTGVDCSIPICINGGHPTPGNMTCDCPAGYTGVHCENELPQSAAAEWGYLDDTEELDDVDDNEEVDDDEDTDGVYLGDEDTDGAAVDDKDSAEEETDGDDGQQQSGSDGATQVDSGGEEDEDGDEGPVSNRFSDKQRVINRIWRGRSSPNDDEKLKRRQRFVEKNARLLLLQKDGKDARASPLKRVRMSGCRPAKRARLQDSSEPENELSITEQKCNGKCSKNEPNNTA